MSAKDGGPAFPCSTQSDDPDDITEARRLGCGIKYIQHGGMSLRDRFALAALQGLLASTNPEHHDPTFEEYSKCAYGHADAMLAERKK